MRKILMIILTSLGSFFQKDNSDEDENKIYRREKKTMVCTVKDYEYVKSEMSKALADFQKTVQWYNEGPAIFVIMDGQILAGLYYHENHLFDSNLLSVQKILLREQHDENLTYKLLEDC